MENRFHYNTEILRNNISNINFQFKKRNLIILVISFLLLAGMIGLVFLVSRNIPFVTPVSSDNRAQVQSAKITKDVKQEFSFPLRDNQGKEVSKFKYIIESAELRNEIIVKGQKATAVKGRVFLIVNLKIVNDYSKAIQVTTRDFVRFSLNSNTQELLAADIHNDPVTVQPKSTKLTRIGLPIDDQLKTLRIFVGELNGSKTPIDINF